MCEVIPIIGTKEYDEYECRVLNISMEELNRRKVHSLILANKYKEEKRIEEIRKEVQKEILLKERRCEDCENNSNYTNEGGYSACIYCDEMHRCFSRRRK